MIDGDPAQVSKPRFACSFTGGHRTFPHLVARGECGVAGGGGTGGPRSRALAHGASFGSYDNLSQFGVLRQPGVVVHNFQAGDQSDQIIPWATLAWTQVHHGQLPLWNPYEALGMPLAFNWQTAALSVPSLIGYLFPLHLAFTVQVVLTLVIAGTGVYALCRVLRLGTLACVFAGTVFELSGPMLGWLGWPHAAVLSWSGWLFAVGTARRTGQAPPSPHHLSCPGHRGHGLCGPGGGPHARWPCAPRVRRRPSRPTGTSVAGVRPDSPPYGWTCPSASLPDLPSVPRCCCPVFRSFRDPNGPSPAEIRRRS